MKDLKSMTDTQLEEYYADLANQETIEHQFDGSGELGRSIMETFQKYYDAIHEEMVLRGMVDPDDDPFADQEQYWSDLAYAKNEQAYLRNSRF